LLIVLCGNTLLRVQLARCVSLCYVMRDWLWDTCVAWIIFQLIQSLSFMHACSSLGYPPPKATASVRFIVAEFVAVSISQWGTGPLNDVLSEHSIIIIFNVMLTLHPCTIFFERSKLGAHYFLVYLSQLLYMFRATMCLLSGEITVSMRYWYFSLCIVFLYTHFCDLKIAHSGRNMSSSA